MTDQHYPPITPPPEMVQEWRKSGPADAAVNNAYEQHIATQAARWGADQQLQLDTERINQAWQKGADQELEACCEWLQAKGWILPIFSPELRATRRPKPKSLKEQALETLRSMQIEPVILDGINVNKEVMDKYDIIRRALESLTD